MLALKIAVGIVLAVVILNVAFWACIILACLLATISECKGKWIKK